MNAERLFKIVLVDLTNDQLKLEEELEKTINSDKEINTKIESIKDILAKMSINENSILRFTKMASNNNETNNVST